MCLLNMCWMNDQNTDTWLWWWSSIHVIGFWTAGGRVSMETKWKCGIAMNERNKKFLQSNCLKKVRGKQELVVMAGIIVCLAGKTICQHSELQMSLSLWGRSVHTLCKTSTGAIREQDPKPFPPTTHPAEGRWVPGCAQHFLGFLLCPWLFPSKKSFWDWFPHSFFTSLYQSVHINTPWTWEFTDNQVCHDEVASSTLTLLIHIVNVSLSPR